MTSMQKPDSLSKDTVRSTLPWAKQALKINSFEAALAKKGIMLEKALQKSGTGSSWKEQYFADLNSYCVP